MSISKNVTSHEHYFCTSEGVIFKLKFNGIAGNLPNVFENYLLNKYQVVLNGVNSSWNKLNASVPQGSVIDPLLFLVYINDLNENISEICLFADDSSVDTELTVHKGK